MRTILATAIVPVLLISAAFADQPDENVGNKPDKVEIPDPTAFATTHSGHFNGTKIEYLVTAGETYLKDKEDEPKAAIFAFAYTKSNLDDDEVRPVTFVWNGGPGSASLWLHMGTFGPKRVSVPSDASHPGAPPYPIIDAPETILDVTDLVFVDPVGTGFSRALGKHESKEFWGLVEDANAISEFIRDWVTEHGRWNSPKFLLGESFGTTRAAAVANILESEIHMSLNGLIFVSQALDYLGSSPYVRDNMTANVTYLPTMAATALYHGKVSPVPESLEAFVGEARLFAVDELLPALFKGNTLDSASRERLRDRLAYFTGLKPEYIERADLRINGFRFAKELLREEGLAVGLLDSRYTRDDIDDVSADVDSDSDAASGAISSAFKTALMDYMRADLKIEWDRLYFAPADEELEQNWRWRTIPDGEPWEPLPVNTARDLSSALRINPSLRVLVASGYYDLITPFFDAEYTLNRHSISADRIQYRFYGAGHMMYVNEPSRTQLLEDVREFISVQTK